MERIKRRYPIEHTSRKRLDYYGDSVKNLLVIPVVVGIMILICTVVTIL